MKNKTLSLALSIPEPQDGRVNAYNLRKIKTYTGYIQGKEIKRSSRWWALFKNQCEKEPVSAMIVNCRVSSGWDEEAATGAYKGESQAEYYRRIGKTKPEEQNQQLIDEAFNKFNFMRF